MELEEPVRGDHCETHGGSWNGDFAGLLGGPESEPVCTEVVRGFVPYDLGVCRFVHDDDAASTVDIVEAIRDAKAEVSDRADRVFQARAAVRDVAAAYVAVDGRTAGKVRVRAARADDVLTELYDLLRSEEER